jgi:hypothetical protein
MVTLPLNWRYTFGGSTLSPWELLALSLPGSVSVFQLLLCSDCFLASLSQLWWRKALFIGEVGLDLTHHRDTIGLHRATMSHMASPCATMRSIVVRCILIYFQITQICSKLIQLHCGMICTPIMVGTTTSVESLHLFVFF